MNFDAINTFPDQNASNLFYPDMGMYQFDLNTCLFYSRLNEFWMHMTQKRKRLAEDSSISSVPRKKMMLTKINSFEQSLDDLFYEWTSINVVLQSIRNAFASKRDASKEHLEEIDRELSIAYDDLNTQVRHLERRIKRMTNDIKNQLGEQPTHDNLGRF